VDPVPFEDGIWVLDADGLAVCTVHGFQEYPERQLADARLIAAAPRLLAALSRIVTECDDGIWIKGGQKLDDARAAIRAAKEGGQQ
jgi:hypothetical protein